MTLQTVPVRVWDLPTRLFHWTLMLCVTGSVVSAPSTLGRRLRGARRPEDHREVGRPLSALSVFAPLALLSAQVGSGVFADDEIASSVPLVRVKRGRDRVTPMLAGDTLAGWVARLGG